MARDDDALVAGWMAFDAPTRAWLKQKLADPVDVFGEPVVVHARREPVLDALAARPMRPAQIAARLGASPEAVAGAVAELVLRRRVIIDDDGFVVRT